MSLVDYTKKAKEEQKAPPQGSIISQDVARERLRRALMAQRSRTSYRFRDPEGISAKYAKPSRLDQGQNVGRVPTEARRQIFKVGKEG